MLISIHAPNAGSDKGRTERISDRQIFQSTLPARGATSRSPFEPLCWHISIHAPRTGSDTVREAARAR